MVLPLLGGCNSENDVPGEVEEEELPISLSASTSVATRAGTDPQIDQDATDRLLNFWVMAWKTVNSTDTQVMDGQLVERESKTADWTYSPLRYWDKAASKYLFVGYESSDPTANVSVVTNTTTNKPELKFTNIPQWQLYSYSVTTSNTVNNTSVTDSTILDDAATKDYMISRSTGTPASYLLGANPGVVHLSFYHLLSRLNIKAFCEANDGVQATTKYLIEKVTLSSFPANPPVAADKKGVPNTSNTLDYTFDYTAEVPTDGTILSNTDYTDFTPSTSPTNQGDLDLYPVESVEDHETTRYLLLSSTKAKPTLISSWIVAPFDLSHIYTSGSGYCLALQVVYDARVYDETTKKYSYTQYTSKWVPITDKDGNLLTKLEPNTEYTLVLDVQKGTLAVLLDVAILPWTDSETHASPHDVHNW